MTVADGAAARRPSSSSSVNGSPLETSILSFRPAESAAPLQLQLSRSSVVLRAANWVGWRQILIKALAGSEVATLMGNAHRTALALTALINSRYMTASIAIRAAGATAIHYVT